MRLQNKMLDRLAALPGVTSVSFANSAPLSSFDPVYAQDKAYAAGRLAPMRRSLVRTSFTLVMLAIAGVMALVLGIVGIYGVITYAVTQRRREIVIRMALGAQPAGLQQVFVRQGLRLAGIGTALGLAAAIGLTRLMSSLLFGITALDPLTQGWPSPHYPEP